MVFTPPNLSGISSLPTDQAVDIDEGVAVNDDSTDRTPLHGERLTGSVDRIEFDFVDPSVSLITFHRPLTV
ncbi:MAG: hypothetical protein ABGW68_00210 [Gammaproteobacteria bacterium]